MATVRGPTKGIGRAYASFSTLCRNDEAHRFCDSAITGPKLICMRPTPHVAIVVPEGALLAGIGTFVDTFEAINRYAKVQYGQVDARGVAKEVVRLCTLGTSVERPRIAHGIPWPVARSIDHHQYDVVVVTRCASDSPPYLTCSHALREWLRAQWEGGALVAGCGGSIVALGYAGLLNGTAVAAPYWVQRWLSDRLPGVRLTPDARVTERNGIFCAAYAADDMLLALELAERMTTPVLADWLRQRMGVCPFGNGPETEVAVPATGNLVERAKHFLHARFAHSVRITTLAAEVGVSRRTLERRFRAYEGISPLEYLQQHRIAVAKRMLQLSDFHLSQIAILVGYSSLPTFARLFKRETGLAPREWRHRAQVRSEARVAKPPR